MIYSILAEQILFWEVMSEALPASLSLQVSHCTNPCDNGFLLSFLS